MRFPLLRAVLRRIAPRRTRYAKGGVIAPSRLHRLGCDEHVLQRVGDQWHCARAEHRRHVCHGNQYDPDTLAWRAR